MADAFVNTMAVLREELGTLRIVELKHVLEQLNLSRTGNKADLVERVAHHVQMRHQLERRSERDHAVNVVREQVVRFHGASRLPASAAAGGGATAIHGGGGGGAGYMAAAAAASGRWGLGGLKPEAAMGGGGVPSTSLAQLGRSRPLEGGGAGSSGHTVDCICRQAAPSWDEVVCTGCQKAFHATCYGDTMKQRNRNHPALCLLCLSLRQNPFFKVEETLLPPTLIGTRAGFDYPFSFRLTLQQQREVMESRQQAGAGAGGRPNQLLVAVRCFPLDLFEGQKGRVQDLTKPPFYAPHSWPLESTLRVNREYAHVKQRQVYYHGAQRKWKGGSEPADVFMHSRVGTNLLTMQHRDEGKTYVLAVQLVRVVPIPDLYQRVLAYPDTPSIAASLERIKDSFKVTCVDSDDEDCGGAGGGGGGAGAMATVTRLSLRCPLGLTPIQTPARGKDCQHLQCFDLDTFLRFNEKGSAAGWKCGVCDRRLTLEDVRVDAFMQDVIRQIEARKLANEDLDSVQIDHEGSWSLYNSAAHSNSRKRKADLLRAEAIDDSDKEDRKPAAPKPTANGTAASASASLASSAAAARRPAASEAIDLTLSSDEEDNTVPTSRLAAPAPAASSAASAAASAGPDLPALVELVDDDPPAVARSPLPPLPPARQAPPSSAAATAAATNPGIPPYRPHIVNPAAHYITHTPMASAAAMQSLQQQQQLQHQQTLNALMSEDTHNLLYGGGGAGGAGGGGAGGGGRYL